MGPTWKRLTQSQCGNLPQYKDVLVKEGLPAERL